MLITTVFIVRGIIPAYAGQTWFLYSNHIITEDHPRIRGTNKDTQQLSKVFIGSSPHTRDKRYRNSHQRSYGRIIPAYAGQTERRIYTIRIQGDHPRIRGTNGFSCPCRKSRAGSSPHTRDKQMKLVANCLLGRIIPAYAGQTCLH